MQVTKKRIMFVDDEPAILSSLKSLLETGKPLAIQMEPPREMIEAIRRL